MSEPTSYILLIPEKIRKKGTLPPLSGTINQDIKALAHEHSEQLLEQLIRIQNATKVGSDTWIKYGGDEVRSKVTGGVETSERNQNQHKTTIKNIERALADAYSQGKNTGEYIITLSKQESALHKSEQVTSIYATPDNVVELIERLKKTADIVEAKMAPHKQAIENLIQETQRQEEQFQESPFQEYQPQGDVLLQQQYQFIATQMPNIKNSILRELAQNHFQNKRRRFPRQGVVGEYTNNMIIPSGDTTPPNDGTTKTIGATEPNTDPASASPPTEQKKSYPPMIGGFGFSQASLDRIIGNNQPPTNDMSPQNPNSVELSTGYIFIIPTDSGNKGNGKKDKKSTALDPITAAQIETLRSELRRIKFELKVDIIAEDSKHSEHIKIDGLKYGGDEGKFTRSGSKIVWDGAKTNSVDTDNIAQALSNSSKNPDPKNKFDIYIASPETLEAELISSFYVTSENFDIFLKALHDTATQTKLITRVELEKANLEIKKIHRKHADLYAVDNTATSLHEQAKETEKYLRQTSARINHSFKELLQRNMNNYFAGRSGLATDLIAIDGYPTEETPDKDTLQFGSDAAGIARDQAERLAKQLQRLRDITNGNLNYGYVGGSETSLESMLLSDYRGSEKDGDKEYKLALALRKKSGSAEKYPEIDVTPINIEKLTKAVEIAANEGQELRTKMEKGNITNTSNGIIIHNVSMDDVASGILSTLKDKIDYIKENPDKRMCNSCFY